MKFTQTMYIHKTNYGGYQAFTSDLSGQRCFEGYIMVAAQEVEFDVPDDLNIVALQVAAIDKQIDAVQDEYATKMRRLNNEKAKLLCLENEA